MKILFLVAGFFPDGAADSLRTKAFIKMLSQNNRIIIVCEHIKGEKYYRGFEQVVMYESNPANSFFGKVTRPSVFIKKVKSVFSLEKPDIVISNCMYDRFGKIYRLCKLYRIPLVINSMEWYHPSTFRYGRLSRHWIMFNYSWKYMFTKASGAITISSLLERHYKDVGMPTIRIPTILDTSNVPFTCNIESNRIKLLFAGTFARTKDSVRQFVEGLDLMKNNKELIEIIICGPSKKEIKTNIGKELFSKYEHQITIMGKISYDKINNLYQNCNYGIFFRPHFRSSEAGFSTKLGEGMSAGCPFIVNCTGDINLYIKNKYNGFLILNESKNGISNILDEIVELPYSEYNAIRLNARKTAERFFNLETYKKELNDFIIQVRNDYDGRKAI